MSRLGRRDPLTLQQVQVLDWGHGNCYSPDESEGPARQGSGFASNWITSPCGARRMNTERLLLKIGGMSCSFCTITIQKAYRRTPGVSDVHVSLAHDEALIEYDPELTTPTELRGVLRQLGYTVRDPAKLRAYDN